MKLHHTTSPLPIAGQLTPAKRHWMPWLIVWILLVAVAIAAMAMQLHSKAQALERAAKEGRP